MATFNLRAITRRCILTRHHYGQCDGNDYDPPQMFERCHGRLFQVDGGPRDGQWLPMSEFGEFYV